MAKLNVSECFGCHKVISLTSVDPGEDNTIPYRVNLPPGHKVVNQYADRVRIQCSEGALSWIRWGSPAAPSTNPSDSIQHETWLEYHDRLIKEYYDTDAEWALIKEICPELDRPEPARAKRPALVVPLMIGAAMNSLLATIAFVFDQFVVGVLGYAVMCALLWGARSF